MTNSKEAGNTEMKLPFFSSECGWFIT